MKCIITERVIQGPSVNEAAIRIAYLTGEPPRGLPVPSVISILKHQKNTLP